jgi:formiminotetrahydrofolate cyclodeaminase
MLIQHTIEVYLARTASAAPVPGGGSASALAAALASALAEMVASLTQGKKGFESAASAMDELRRAAAELRSRCAANIDRDARAYDAVVAALRLPKASAAEREARTAALQAALVHAARVPLETARGAHEALELAATAAAHGNPNAVTDAIVAVMLARTAVRGALYNVRINLAGIQDQALVAAMAAEAQRLEAEVEAREQAVLAKVQLPSG